MNVVCLASICMEITFYPFKLHHSTQLAFFVNQFRLSPFQNDRSIRMTNESDCGLYNNDANENPHMLDL